MNNIAYGLAFFGAMTFVFLVIGTMAGADWNVDDAKEFWQENKPFCIVWIIWTVVFGPFAVRVWLEAFAS